jgi:hypothetical protein
MVDRDQIDRALDRSFERIVEKVFEQLFCRVARKERDALEIFRAELATAVGIREKVTGLLDVVFEKRQKKKARKRRA